MKRAVRPLRRISGQIGLLIVLSMLAVNVIATLVFWLDRQYRDPDDEPRTLTFAARLVANAPAANRSSTLAALQTTFPGLRLQEGDVRPQAWAGSTESEQPPEAGAPKPEGSEPGDLEPDAPPRVFPIANAIRDHLGPTVTVTDRQDGPEPRQRRVVVRLADGYVFSGRVEERRRLWVGPAAVSLSFVVVTLTIVTLWVARALTRPLTDLAAAVEAFQPERATLVRETGPAEIRDLARAFNGMQTRIAKLVADRTRMLAAVSHDLRTPITRLRLRAEFVDNDANRAAMLADLDQMGAMVESALSFLREGRTQTSKARVDLPALLRTIVDRFSDMGRPIAYEGPERFPAEIRPDEIERAVTNLADNALKYGTDARIRLVPGVDEVTIEVVDDGPGIPHADRDAMLDPFVRGDAARTMTPDSGFGLGLSIARAIAEGHGGRLVFDDPPTGRGLIVRLVLPIA